MPKTPERFEGVLTYIIFDFMDSVKTIYRAQTDEEKKKAAKIAVQYLTTMEIIIRDYAGLKDE